MTMHGALGPNEALIGVPGSRQQLSTPALVIELDRLERNIAAMAAHCRANGHGLRPVAKIHKSVEIARRQVEAGALGVCCATLAEAEIMVEGGIPGVMMFSSVVTPPKIARLIALNARARDLMVAVDDAENVAALDAAAGAAGQRLKLLVDFEVGGRRTGIASEDAIVRLARQVADSAALEFVGVQGYNGGLQATPDYAERAQRQAACVAPLRTLCQRLTEAGLAPGIVTGGGTGTHDIDPGQGVLSESQAGTYIFMDVNYGKTRLRRDGPAPFEVALDVRATVISTSQAGFAITDAGVKELARDSLATEILSGAPPGATYDVVGDDLGRVNLPDGARPLRVGDALECVTPHCYATLNLYSVYHCVRGDTLVDIWPIEARATW